MTGPIKADANPTRAFFVRTITRDISLEDCILDLIDNSVDGAWRLEGGRPMSLGGGSDLSRYLIEINTAVDGFRIKDNCGGITLDDAANYAFTFGRKDDVDGEKYSIGVYGIGMKRALFKMGSDVRIHSTYRVTDGSFESFAVPIDVPAWLGNKSTSWDFDIEPAQALVDAGVEITIEDLNEETQTSFSNPLFLQNLRRIISRDYSLHLHRGLIIKLNDKVVPSWEIAMLESHAFSPMRKQYQDIVGENEREVVEVEILAGMAAPPPESNDPDEDDTREDRFGWYVVCNGRIVLAADKTEFSGWGTDGWPHWHPQYLGFIGMIMFTSENAALLPLTTTKRSVDVSSAVYRRARPHMREATKQWIAYTNARKQALEDAKKMEAEAKPLSIFSAPQREIVTLPTFAPQPRKERPANISYSMPITRVKSLASKFGNINMSYREVGVHSFEHAYSDLVGEE